MKKAQAKLVNIPLEREWNPKKKFLTLYGVKVPAPLWSVLKEVADLLALQTFTNISLKEARKRGVVVAMEAFVKMTTPSPSPKVKGIKKKRGKK